MAAWPRALTRRRPVLEALVLGGIAATGFAPLGFWPATLACLAGLIAILAGRRTLRGAILTGYVFGIAHFSIGLNWIAHAFTFQDAMPHRLGYPAVFLLSLYLAVYPAAATGIAWLLGRGSKAALTLALAGSWLLTEYLRAVLFTGFAWNPLGVIWLDTGLEHLAPFIGTYGLGALAVIAAGALLGLATRAWLALVPLALLGLATCVAPSFNSAGGMTHVPITVVQPLIGQDEKYAPALERANFLKLERLSSLPDTRRAAGRLVFWPEAAIYAILDMEPAWRAALASRLAPDELLMAGGDKYRFHKTGSGRHAEAELVGANNSLWVLDAEGRIRGRYDKAHLVPYGEYLPMRPILSAIGLSRLVPGDIDFWPGPGPRTLPLPPAPGRPALTMGVQICYEIIFSGQVIDTAHRPDFLFNPSNDGWFGAWGPPQHLAQARLRAVEEAMPVIRSTPTGISAVVDARGRIVARIAPGTAGAINTMLPAPASATVFSAFGNIVPLTFAMLLIASAVALASARR